MLRPVAGLLLVCAAGCGTLGNFDAKDAKPRLFGGVALDVQAVTTGHRESWFTPVVGVLDMPLSFFMDICTSPIALGASVARVVNGEPFWPPLAPWPNR